MRRIYEENGIIHYYGNLAGYITENVAVIDAIFDKNDLRNFATRELGKSVEVKEEISKRLSLEEGESKTGTDGRVRPGGIRLKTLGLQIFQLGKESPLEERFISLQKRQERGFKEPGKAEYDLVYEGEVERFDLEDIWERFARSVPKDFGGHALSISDVVVFTDGESERSFYLDQSGFTEIEFS